MLESPTWADLASSFSPVLGSFDSAPTTEVALIVVCAWCEQEGKKSILRQPTSLDHLSPTCAVQSHGICQPHREQIFARFIAD
jgi:hypothetical protein